MTAREILALFCAQPLHHREYLRQPWRAPGHGMVASNGHILVVLPDDGGDLASEPAHEHLIGIVGRFKTKWPGGPDWIKLSDVDLPASQPCADCEGSGVWSYSICTSCEGDGQTQDLAICTSCNGDGEIHVPGGADNSDLQHAECVGCSGRGQAFQKVPVGVGHYSRLYLEILASLPACEISPRETDGAAFHFDGGHGWIMPVRAGV